MPIQQNGVAPYAPAATILSVVDRARERGLPTPVNKDVLMRAGVSDSLIPRTLQALQLLELINEDGTWTQNLETLRRAPEADLQSTMAAMIRSVYAEVFQYVDPSTDGATRIRDAFRSFTPHGQQDRMVTLFMGLCQRAGIAAAAGSSTKSTPREPRIAKKVPSPKPSTKSRSSPVNGSGAALSTLPSPLAGLLETLPLDGWTKSNRDRFVGAFTAMLDYCIPVRTEAELRADQKIEAE